MHATDQYKSQINTKALTANSYIYVVYTRKRPPPAWHNASVYFTQANEHSLIHF